MKRKLALVLVLAIMLSSVFCVNASAAKSDTHYCYTLSTGNVTVYKDSSLKTKYGTIYGSSDEIQLLSTGSVLKVKYPVTNRSGKITGYKTGYISRGAVTKGNFSDATKSVASKQINTYRRSDGKVSYGYVAKGDTIKKLATSGGYTQLVYPVKNGYKVAWVKTSELSTTTSNKYTNTLDKMMKGTSYSGAYKLNTKYAGEYASEQCKGFAKSVHKKLFGYNIGSTKSKPNNYQLSYSSSNTKLVGSIKSMSTTAAKNLFTQARAGDFVQMRRTHGGSHSAIVYSASSTGITFYEANLDGRNGIVKKTYTWKELCNSNAAMSLYTAKKY